MQLFLISGLLICILVLAQASSSVTVNDHRLKINLVRANVTRWFKTGSGGGGSGRRRLDSSEYDDGSSDDYSSDDNGGGGDDYSSNLADDLEAILDAAQFRAYGEAGPGETNAEAYDGDYLNPPNVLTRDPKVPSGAKIATAAEGHDPFAGIPHEVWTSKDGSVTFNFTKEALADSILEPETRLSGEVEVGTRLRGRVVKDGQPLIEYWVGDLPIVMFCIHTNDLGWQPYMKNWPPSRRACRKQNCDTLTAWAKLQALTDEDFASLSDRQISKRITRGLSNRIPMQIPLGDGAGEHCNATYQYILQKTGGKHAPHMVYSHIPKLFLDFNRGPSSVFLKPRGTLAKEGLLSLNPEIYASYHDALGFIREAKNVVARTYGVGWMLNFHTMGGSRRFGIGLGWKEQSKRLYLDASTTREMVYNRRALPHLYADADLAKELTPYESLYGKYALGEILSNRGLGAAPSRAWRYWTGKTDSQPYSGSTYMESHFGPRDLNEAAAMKRYMDNLEVTGRPVESWYRGAWNTALVESYSKYVSTYGRMFTDTVGLWGETLIDLSTEYFGLSNLTRLDNYTKPYKSLNTTYAAVTPGSECKDAKIKTLTASRLAFYLPECVEACATTSGCAYVSMSTVPNGKRVCHLHKTCKKVQDKRYFTIIDVNYYLNHN